MIVETVIDQLLQSGNPKGVKLGEELKKLYEDWKTSNIFDQERFEALFSKVTDKRKEIVTYTPRADTTIKMMSGKLFEEYVSILLKTMCHLDARNFRLFWDENITFWKGLLPREGDLKEDEMKFKYDIVIGRTENEIKKPYLIIECSKWVDFSILCKLAFRFLIAKKVNPTIPCLIVTRTKGYKRSYEYFLSGIVDGIFNISNETEIRKLRDYVNDYLDKFTRIIK